MAKAQGPEAMQPKANNETAELQRIEELRVKLKTPASIYSGVCAAKDWRPGKEVTEAEYREAVAAFSGAPMGKKVE